MILVYIYYFYNYFYNSGSMKKKQQIIQFVNKEYITN